MRQLLILALVGSVVAGCSSAEASRQRGQPGADPGNHARVVDMHGKTDPAHDTPQVGKAAQLERK